MKYHLEGSNELISVITLDDVTGFLKEIDYKWDGNYLIAKGYVGDDINWSVNHYKNGQDFSMDKNEEYIVIDVNLINLEFTNKERKRLYFNLWEFMISDIMVIDDQVEAFHNECFDEKWIAYLLNHKKGYSLDLESAYTYKIKSLISESEAKIERFLKKVNGELKENLDHYNKIKELIDMHKKRGNKI